MKSLPIGVSTFEKLIKEGSLYVDKTQILYELIKDQQSKRYFLSCPRRFGKSTTCATLKAIFEGKKDLFKDLWLGQSDYEFVTRPVIYFDFSEIDHDTADILASGLHATLELHAQKYGVELVQVELKAKFAELIEKLSKQHGPVILIVDEYDKPITDLLEDIQEAESSRKILKKFYGTLKGKTIHANVQLIFITGVSKFSKVALFSDLNNLKDLTTDKRTAALVGYTDQEVDHYLTEHIQVLAQELNQPYQQTRKILKEWYNGYRFTDANLTVYNPFSLHNCLVDQKFSNYWFTTGTPNFLMDFIKKNPQIAVDIETVEGSFFSAVNLESFSLELYYEQYKTLLLQTGYLTFASDFDAGKNGYKIAYPNEEVRYSMIGQIMQFVGNILPEHFGEFGDRFRKALAADDLGLFCKHLEDFIKLVPHNIIVHREKFYQQIFFMVCVLFGKRPATEVAIEEGFMDLLMEGTKYTFVVEFKRDSTPEKALEQIEAKRYWEPFAILPGKKIVLAGITFKKTKKGTFVLYKIKNLGDKSEKKVVAKTIKKATTKVKTKTIKNKKVDKKTSAKKILKPKAKSKK